jgi:hypothetical protein
MGTGKFGLLLREQIDWAKGQRTIHLTGVEAWPDYIGEHQKLAYDEIVVADIRDYLRETDDHFDLALLLDVIEHFEPEDAVAVCDRALTVSDVLLVTTPARFFNQDGADGFEKHRSWWPTWKLRELASRVGAQADVAKIEHNAFAAFSRVRKPVLEYDPPTKAFARMIRDTLIRPRDNGPTI